MWFRKKRIGSEQKTMLFLKPRCCGCRAVNRPIYTLQWKNLLCLIKI